MTPELINIPATRSWRDIPQPVKPRTMSWVGRLRLAAATLRVLGVLAIVGATSAGVWLVWSALKQDPRAMPQVAKTVPVRPPELTTDGVLSAQWLARTLAIPPKATLMELDLEQLRLRLLTDGQVNTATLTRAFPDRLLVSVTERTPVARIMVERAGQRLPLLVARDGVVFIGEGFDPQMLETLPWLDGVALVREGGGLVPIEGMQVVGELLAKARLEAEHLYRSWTVVSLARLKSDRELEVRTNAGVTVVFSARGDFFRQLAKLDYMWDQVARVEGAQVHVDLSLGREVPVRIQMLEPAENAAARPAPSASAGPRVPFVSPFVASSHP